MFLGYTNLFLHEQKNLPITFYTVSTYYPQKPVKTRGDFYHILFPVKGNGYVIFNKKKYPLNVGSGFFKQPHCPIEYYGDNDFATAYLTAYGPGFPGLIKYLKCDDFMYFENINTERFIPKLDRIIKEYSVLRRGEILSSLTYSFFVDFLGQNNNDFMSISDRVAHYIENNYSQKLTLEKLAKIEHISVSKLCHDFKNKFGCTIFEYILRARLSQAKNEITNFPEKPVKDIALSCGFNDVSYFCRAFKEEYGRTPSESKKSFRL